MTQRVLRWVPGKPAQNGVVYYMKAWHNEVEFSIAKFVTENGERFGLWRGKALIDFFDERLAALNHAETLV